MSPRRAECAAGEPSRNMRFAAQATSGAHDYASQPTLRLMPFVTITPLRSVHSEKGQSGGNESSQRRPFPPRKTDCSPDLRILPGHWASDSVENYANLFTISLRNDDIQEFDSKWDGNLLSMTKIPPDDILEGLYKIRIRGFEKLKTVLELYNMEIHQKKAGPDYHRLQTMAKRSIEQNLRIKNFEARNGNYERNAVVKNQGTKQRGQRILGDCWQWKANGQCSKGDNFSFRHDMNKRAKIDTVKYVSEFFHAAE